MATAVAVAIALLAAWLTYPWWMAKFARVEPLDPVPSKAANGCGSSEMRGRHMVLHLSGTPAEMGAANGELMKLGVRRMIKGYVDVYDEGNPEQKERKAKLLAGVRRMRASLPPWFVTELDACAEAAGVDKDKLLLAQCLGDMETAVAGRTVAGIACTAYVAFGAATVDGRLEAGRNLDYGMGREITGNCALVTYYEPDDGHKFVAIGWTGMLTGWTLINEHGLIVANHIGGGTKSSLDAVPTLILARMIAQRAATVEEGLTILRKTPRMRRQIIWMAQDAAGDRPARAVAAEYDNAKVVVREAEDGVLIVTNSNRVFWQKPGEIKPESDMNCGRTKKFRKAIEDRSGRLDGSEWLSCDLAYGSTLHIVHFVPKNESFGLRHGVMPAGWASPVVHPFPGASDKKEE